jgi:hypothetical protein
MRFMIMHKTNAHWESGAIPTPDLIARVGTLLGELQSTGALLAGEGLRASSQGVRLRFSNGQRTVAPGPFERGNELPAGFSIVRGRSIDDAIDWASAQAAAWGDCELDIRPVTEPWDIGLADKPQGVTERRYMILRKATASSEAGPSLSSDQRARLSRLVNDTTNPAVHLVTETMLPSARGRRYTNSHEGVRFVDGPFSESKELIGGYVMVSATSLDDAGRWAELYIRAVETNEVDLRELE